MGKETRLSQLAADRSVDLRRTWGAGAGISARHDLRPVLLSRLVVQGEAERFTTKGWAGSAFA